MDDRYKKPTPLQIKGIQTHCDCLLLGGFASTIQDFIPLLDAMRPLKPLLLLIPEGNLSQVIASLIDFIQDTIDRPVPLMGYSMGGRIAFELVKNAPECFSQLVCLSTRLFPKNKNPLFEEMVEQKLSQESLETFFSWWYSQPIFAGYSPDAKLLIEKRKIPKKVLLKQFQHLKISRFPPLALHTLPPTHLIYGVKDPLLLEVEDCIKNSDAPIFIHKVDSAGHLIHLEQTDRLSQLLQRILL